MAINKMETIKMEKRTKTSIERQDVSISDYQSSRDEKLLAILNQHRHNWLNDLQLIFGYIKLKKYDRLDSYMERLKDKLDDEGAISRIANPTLALELMFFKHSTTLFALKVVMEQGFQLPASSGFVDNIRETLLATLHIFKEHAHILNDKENELIVTICDDSEGVLLVFEYSGGYDLEQFELAFAKASATWREQGNKIQWTSDAERLKAVILMAKPL